MSSACGALAPAAVQVGPEADVDELDDAGVAAAGVDQQSRLDRAEGHGDIGPDGGPVDVAGVGVDAASAGRPRR